MIFQVRLILTTSFLLLLTSLNLQSLAATRVSLASGNWSNVGTWGGAVPAANDDIVISSGTTVHVNILFTVSMTFHNVTIEQGGSLLVGLDDVKLRIKGNLTNDGTLNLWQSSKYQADIWLYGNSVWSGSGIWNLSNVNVQSYSLEPAEGSTFTLNGSLTAFAGSSFNKLNRYPNITIYIQGTVNTMISSYPDFYYGHLIISKAASRTVSFSPSGSSNMIKLLGNLTLINSTDTLIVEAYNTLTLLGEVTGAGLIKGSSTSSLVVDNLDAPAINPLRILGATHFRDFIINRRAGVTLSNGFVIRESLRLNNACRLTLPPQTLTLGINGTNPTAGSFSGNGTFIGSNSSSLSIRGKDTASVKLRFDQASVSNYTLNTLLIEKKAGKVVLDTGNLLLTGKLNISDRNIFSIGSGTLIVNIVPSFSGSGCLSGSRDANLTIAGASKTGYQLFFDQSTPFGNSLKSYTQSRNAVITLASKMNIAERVSLTGDSSILVSDGNLTLLSSSDGSAGISSLINNNDVKGDVNVQVYFSGDNENMKYRGYRSISSPVNDEQILTGQKRSLEQLKDFIIITGPGGVANGFDQGGIAQPYAETLTKYNPHALPGSLRFLPITNITHPFSAGQALLAFFRGKQRGSYLLNTTKLNAPYSPPEPVAVVYKGMINKFDLPAITLFNANNPGDDFNGYNLIGNPYPSAIEWTKVTRSAGVNDEVITIKPGGGTATYLNGFSNNGGSPYIQTGQGFYVRTAVDRSTVSFKEEAKTSSYPARLLSIPNKHIMTVNSQSFEVGDEIRSNSKVLKLNLDNGSDRDETTIVFKPGETAEGNYDDAMYFGGSTVNLSSKSANEKSLAINFMPDIYFVEEVRLSVNASSSGAYKLNFTEVPVSSVAILLKDSLQQNILTEVKKNLCYSFTIDKNNPATFGDKRFTLILRAKNQKDRQIPSGKIGDSIQTYPNPVINQEVFFDVTSLPEEAIQLMIYDVRGRKVQTLAFRKGEEIKTNVSLLQPGIYLAKFRSVHDGKVLGETLFIKY